MRDGMPSKPSDWVTVLVFGIFGIFVAFILASCSSVAGNSTTDPTSNTSGTTTGNAAVISRLIPASVTINSGTQQIHIIGTGFASDASATFNGLGRITTFVSSTEVVVDLLAEDTAISGNFDIAVTNMNSPASNAVPLAVSSLGITSLSPSSSPIGATPIVQITGFGFSNTSVVSYNGAAHASTYVSTTQITIALDAADTSAAGLFPIIVSEPGGLTSNTTHFEVASARITNLAPVGTIASSTPFTLTIAGVGFNQGAAVTVTDSTGTTTYPVSNVNVAPSSITATVTINSPPPGNYVHVQVDSSTPAVLGVASAAATLSGQVQPLFTQYCTTGCHSSTTNAGQLTLVSSLSYTDLVNATSSGCAGFRVVPGDPRSVSSILVDKISSTSPCSGTIMPKKGLAAADIQTVIDWVAQGAPQ